MEYSRTRGDARAASDRGCAALEAGRRDEAVRWLDRARRLAPQDVSVAFMLASALVGLDDARAHAILVEITTEHPAHRDARVALAAAEHRAGRPHDAARRLAALLGDCAPPAGPAFARLADAIARATGAPGWVGATSEGRLMLSTLQGAATSPRHAPVHLALDGAAIALPRGAAARLPAAWRKAGHLAATSDGVHLLGSPIRLAALRRVEGCATIGASGDLEGWAWHPGDPDAAPRLTLLGAPPFAGPAIALRAGDRDMAADPGFGAILPNGFRVPAHALPAAALLRVVTQDGHDLAGSPLPIGAERAASARAAATWALAKAGRAPPMADAWRPLPVELAPPPGSAARRPVPRRAAIDVVIPVYRGAADLAACLATLRRDLPSGTRIIVVDDGSPDVDLVRVAEEAATRGEITLLRHAANRGFPAAANTGLRHAAAGEARDVVLLNADTLIPAGAIARLSEAAYSAGDIGSVTPLSNDGSIVSYPAGERGPGDETCDAAGADLRDGQARAANGDDLVDIPTAVGFCMFIRHDCLGETGVLREDAFAQGYGEENDWCLRGRQLGWRHVAATGVFVGHLGGRSFGPLKMHLLERNLRVLNRLHPGYDAMVAAFVTRDPLAHARRRLDVIRWKAARRRGRAVLLVTHDLGGGIERHIRERCATLRTEGVRPIVLRPAAFADGTSGCTVSDGPDGIFADLRFALPSEAADLARLLRGDRPRAVEVHHLLRHAPAILGLAGLLGVPTDVVIHDYGLWCPRVTLCGRTQGYCGEPSRIEECEACVADLGDRFETGGSVADWRARATALLTTAREVVVPCDDAATRIRRHFPSVRPSVRAWEADDFDANAQRPAPGAMPRGKSLRVVVPGAIGIEKGYDVLLACARDAANRALALRFFVVGHTIDDARLLDTGTVFVTGRYEEDEAIALIRSQNGDMAFIPSIWPETWCYALSNAWRAGLPAMAFALGAQAERIARAGTGAVLPLGLSASRVNDTLMDFARRPRVPAPSRQPALARNA